MRGVSTTYDILNLIDECILNNNETSHYILFMKIIHNFILESNQIHYDYQIELLNQTNYILTKLYGTSNIELKDN